MTEETKEQVTESKHLTKEEATAFFAELYGGEHHIPKHQVFEYGNGWMVKHDRGDLATYDFSQLTKLVLMSHDRCIRASIEPLNMGTLKIAIWKRNREGGMDSRHPTIEQAIESFRKYNP
jgi:hypothetical protein